MELAIYQGHTTGNPLERPQPNAVPELHFTEKNCVWSLNQMLMEHEYSQQFAMTYQRRIARAYAHQLWKITHQRGLLALEDVKPQERKPSPLQHAVLPEGIFQYEGLRFAEEQVARDGNCGFHILGKSRIEALAAFTNAPENMRGELIQLMQPEIQAYLEEVQGGYPNDLPNILRGINVGTLSFAQVVAYVNYIYRTHSQYLGYQDAGAEFANGGGFLVALAHLYNREVHVYRQGKTQLVQALHFRPENPQGTLYFLHTDGLHHFNLLREATAEELPQGQGAEDATQSQPPATNNKKSDDMKRDIFELNVENIRNSLSIVYKDYAIKSDGPLDNIVQKVKEYSEFFIVGKNFIKQSKDLRELSNLIMKRYVGTIVSVTED